ncbi:beta-phosphoglucomutase [Fulvivirga sp. M361]|uniref:beta-phosphoglucomutase n=1 Tax=Fulvivirga sp. M361 TaxID=2594266 RepID=UPI001179E19A|nr:beta-phosphoglucomutase [Fulvivirga sp. M361]TRX50937.1 beta-phosphoglucomutase [Fulvivirga sp. M361]
MAEIKALIFDLDGVIVDTAEYHYAAWKRLADQLGITFTKADNELLKGVSRVKSFDILLGLGPVEMSEGEKEPYRDQKNKWFVEYISKMTPADILPGVVDFIAREKENNRKIVLGSASKNAASVLKNVELIDAFDAIVDGTHVSAAKPDPEVFLKGAEAVQVAPKNCLVFEDAAAGVEAAINGDMYCVGIGAPEVLGKAHWVVPGIGYIKMEEFKRKIESL